MLSDVGLHPRHPVLSHASGAMHAIRALPVTCGDLRDSLHRTLSDSGVYGDWSCVSDACGDMRGVLHAFGDLCAGALRDVSYAMLSARDGSVPAAKPGLPSGG